MQQPTHWLEIFAPPVDPSEDSALQTLDAGERAAIILAESLRADLLLIVGEQLATCAVLYLVCASGQICELGRLHVVRLQKTNFRYPPSIMEALLAKAWCKSSNPA